MKITLTAMQITALSMLSLQDGVRATEMEIVSVEKVCTRMSGHNHQPSEYQYRIDFHHPKIGVISAYMDAVTRDVSWAYLGEKCTVNGVVYPSIEIARLIRAALAAEGVSRWHPCAARSQLAKHGLQPDGRPARAS